MDIKLTVEGLAREFWDRESTNVKKAVSEAIVEITGDTKLRLRAQVEAAGLGKGVSNAWRDEYYPKDDSPNKVGFLYTKAPNIVDAFNSGKPIKAKNGHTYLAIPTSNVPRTGRGHRRMTPEQVEERFGATLRFIPDAKGGGVLTLDNIVRGKNGRGFRKASKRRLAQGRRELQVVMFVLRRQVLLAKKLDVERVAAAAEARLPILLLEKLSATDTTE